MKACRQSKHSILPEIYHQHHRHHLSLWLERVFYLCAKMRKSTESKHNKLKSLQIDQNKDGRPRRQQFTSCDMCRKGKRACDGRWKMDSSSEKEIICTLCERKGLKCTFNMAPYADGINHVRQARKLRHSQQSTPSDIPIDVLHASISVPELLQQSHGIFPDNMANSTSQEFPLSNQAAFIELANSTASGSNLRLDNLQPILPQQLEMDTNTLSYLHQSTGQAQSVLHSQDTIDYPFVQGRSSTSNNSETPLQPMLDSRESSLNLESDRYYLREYAHSITSVTLGLSLACWIASDNNPLLSSAAFSGMKFSSANTNSNNVLTWLTIDKVYSLDKNAHPHLGLSCSSDVDEIATQKAVDLALLAFATQWEPRALSRSPGTTTSTPSHSTHDSGRASLWIEALQHLLAHSHLNSFRFILASILFAWTEPPKSLFYDQSFTGGISSAPKMTALHPRIYICNVEYTSNV